jgi:SNF2 family DNA or RNA helicase
VLTAKVIHEQLGSKSIILPGGQAPEARQAILSAFKTDESKKVLIANPASSGHGITLTEADTVIYYSNSYNLEHRLQSEDRTHRIGQQRPVVYIDLIAPGTVEGAVVKALRDKKNLADVVINSQKFMELINGN